MLLMLLLSALPAWAAPECGPFRVGVRLYPLVYERVPGTQEYRGLDKEFFALLAERSGCRFQFELESQPRIWARLRNGSLDLTSWAIATAEREALVVVVPLVRIRRVAVTWTAQGVKSDADFLARSELTAVAVRDGSYGTEYDALMDKLRAQNRLSEVADVSTSARLFFARRIGLLVTYPWVVAEAVRELPPGEVQMTDWYPQSTAMESGLAISRSTVSEADQRRLLEALQGMQRDGSLARLLRQTLPVAGIQVLPRIVARP